MKRLLLAALVLIAGATSGSASSIFTPPPEAVRYDGFTIVTIQQPAHIVAACGVEMPWGCPGWLRQVVSGQLIETCLVRIVAGLLPEMEAAAEANLRARCGGWPGI